MKESFLRIRFARRVKRSGRQLGFPEPALSSYEMSQNVQNAAAAADAAEKRAASAQTFGIIGTLAGILGIAFAGIAWKRK